MAFGDGTAGMPYVIARGAIPAGGGNGYFGPQYGQECDKGTENGNRTSLCFHACECRLRLNERVGACHAVGNPMVQDIRHMLVLWNRRSYRDCYLWSRGE